MALRPHNHVVTEAAQKFLAVGSEWPEVPLELVEYLEAIYPERCYRADRESLAEHQQYAGAAGLVQDLRAVFEEQRRAAIEADPEGEAGALSVEVQ